MQKKSENTPLDINQTPTSLLDSVVQCLNEEVGEFAVSAVWRNARAVALKQDALIISVPTTLERDTLIKRFTDNVSKILSELTGHLLHPEYLTEEEAQQWIKQNSDLAYANYTFKNFIVGPCNRFAHAAALTVAEADFSLHTERIYNPLLIYGPSGLGKTHLLYAVANRFKERYPNLSIVYIKSEDFLNEVVAGIKTGIYDFRKKYRNADLFLVDDIQFFGGKEFVQEEFFHTFNTLYEARKQIVVTADRPPKEIATLTDRIRTRLEWGLPIDVKSPDLETRIALVDEKSRRLGVTLDGRISEYIAQHITNNVRELEGAVQKIVAMNTLLGLKIDMALVKEAIGDILKDRPGLHPTPQLILSEVSAFYCIPEDKILSSSRQAEIVIARQVACLLMRDMADMSYPEIGKFIGRDHATVMHSVEKVQQIMEKNHEIAAGVADLRKNIESR